MVDINKSNMLNYLHVYSCLKITVPGNGRAHSPDKFTLLFLVGLFLFNAHSAERQIVKIKRLKRLTVNSITFEIKWDKTYGGGGFDYVGKEISIGIKKQSESEIFMIVCHELMEIVAVEMNVRLRRPDCDTEYIFVYDHRQYDTMMSMFSGLISQFMD